ncbi:MAG: SpoIID/LytB domain-containing protein [Bacteroidota bacterium]
MPTFNRTLSAAILIIILILFPDLANCQSVPLKVRLFSGKQIKAVNLCAVSGIYNMKSGNKALGSLKTSSKCTLKLENGQIKLEKSGKIYGSFNNISLTPKGPQPILNIKSNAEDRNYEGAFTIKILNGDLLIINNIELEKYVAGVVESEGGDAHNTEFYKLQCMISRTYAVKNLRKHEAEGFNFCDQVHCQHYKERGRYSDVLLARDATKGKVIVDQYGNLISAAFHANSGGETVSAEDVWSFKENYLKGINDTFSTKMTKAKWEKKIKTEDFLSILKSKYNYPVDNKIMRDSAITFTQIHRKLVFPGGIALKALRIDLDLRSTYFSIEPNVDSLTFHGNGYGHGVGLSQEGALQMARTGYSSDQILNFYYNNVKIQRLEKNMIPKKP